MKNFDVQLSWSMGYNDQKFSDTLVINAFSAQRAVVEGSARLAGQIPVGAIAVSWSAMESDNDDTVRHTS